MIDGSVLQSAQGCFEKKSRVVVKMVVICWFWSLPDQSWWFLKVFGKFKKSKMADPRWPPFENKPLLWWKHFWTYYLSFKFRCHSFNILGVKRRGRNPAPPPRSHKTKKSPVWIGLKELKERDWKLQFVLCL